MLSAEDSDGVVLSQGSEDGAAGKKTASSPVEARGAYGLIGAGVRGTGAAARATASRGLWTRKRETESARTEILWHHLARKEVQALANRVALERMGA